MGPRLLISLASVGAIQRALVALETEGADRLFGKPALNLDDLLQTDAQGRGVVNLLAANRLIGTPKVYSTLLLWLLSDVYERLPEVGDLPKPKLVLFFDEAHLRWFLYWMNKGNRRSCNGPSSRRPGARSDRSRRTNAMR